MPIIASNAGANTSLRYLNQNSADQQSYLAKLSSGSRITSAKDDAGGLGVATRLQGDVTALSVAARNAAQGQAVVQTADGALARIADVLQRMKALATQAVSGSVDNTARGYLEAEYAQLNTQIQDVVGDTEFNGTDLFDGNYTGAAAATVGDFLVGVDATDLIEVVIATGANYDPRTVGIATAANAVTEIGNVDTQIGAVSAQRAAMGAFMSRFDFQGQIIATTMENLDAARATIQDADIAEMQTNFTTAETLTEAAIAALGKANEMPSELLRLLQ